MKDIELRFVEGIEPISEGTGRIIRKLQFRKLKSMAFNADYDKWTEWEDVPFVKGEL